MKTAIDSLIDSLPERYRNAMLNTCQEEIRQAKELYKAQIKDAYNDGYFGDAYKYKDWEDYYEQTYNQNTMPFPGANPDIKEI